MSSILILQKEAKEGKKDKDSDKEDEDAGKWGKIERKMNPFSSNRIPVNKDNKYYRKKGSKPMYETHHWFFLLLCNKLMSLLWLMSWRHKV